MIISIATINVRGWPMARDKSLAIRLKRLRVFVIDLLMIQTYSRPRHMPLDNPLSSPSDGFRG